ncbi:2-keto-3-deoxy-L-fuconate dehydrogenase [Granulicella pectinivorans]|uniref:2-keto-3-deoxy-L-fuconate dehydrogenase n=1 Tax=Granulicella pectinivorans TaxID=474950 RepID=A0A1I6MXI9_9BACT|nr:SDR family oxidoreductase [Granulicella pectinivorans]SFS20426.1 2-keto-3-deoxy-L-fuconate dehydrogenase [Granulicella pectinivorans]
MGGRLAGKLVVMTAAGQGIGRACALRFAAEGATVWATDVNSAALEQLSAEHPTIRNRTLNVRDGEAISALAEELGPVDVLFNCVGYVHQGDIFACTQQDWELSFDLNVTSMYRTCRAFLPAMVAAGTGNILNMSSVASSIKGAPNRFVYGTTKAAVIGLTKSIAADFVGKGIRCNAICPGTIETPSLHDRMAAQGDMEKARVAFLARQPMGRLGRAEEIADLALYLASDESSFTTGQTHIIDGGWAI